MCLKNIIQTGMTVRMYAQDWDERLPPFDHWMDRTQPYAHSWLVCHCPEVDPVTSFGYGLNDSVVQLSKVRRPYEYPLIYESRDLRKNGHGLFPEQAAHPSRHGLGRVCVIYADGHYNVLYRGDGSYQPASP
jgi:hypothetical protein